MRLARRGDAAAGRRSRRPRPTARTAASRRGRSSPAAIEEISPLAASRFPASAFRLTISCGSTGRAESGFFLLAADRRGRPDGLGSQAVERRRHHLRRDEGPRAGAAPAARPRPASSPAWPTRSRARPTCRSSSIAGPPTPSSGMPSATRPSSWAESCWARNASTRQPASRSSGSPSRSRPSTTPTPRPASPTPTTRGRRSPASATGCFPECDIVGWYHTHPSFGIFLSHHDLFIHQQFLRPAAPGGLRRRPDQPDPRLFPVARRRTGAGRRLLPDGRSRRSDRPGAAGQRPGTTSQSRRRRGRELSPSPRGGADQDAHPTRTVVPGFARRAAPDRHGLRHARHVPRRARRGRWRSGSTSSRAGSRSRTRPSSRWPATVEQLGDNQRLATDTLIQQDRQRQARGVRRTGTTRPPRSATRQPAAARGLQQIGHRGSSAAQRQGAGGQRSRPPREGARRSSKDDAKEAPKLRERVAEPRGIATTASSASSTSWSPTSRRPRRARRDVDLLRSELGRTRYCRLHRLGHHRALGRRARRRVLLLQAALAGRPRSPSHEDGERPTHRIV